MFRLYLVATCILFVVGLPCTIQANNTLSLASSLLLFVLGAGGLSAGFMARIGSR